MILFSEIRRLVKGLAVWIIIALLRTYQYGVSPILHTLAPGGGCRFYPTCSEYAMEAVRKHGPLGGGWLAFKRLVRCHPFGGHGYDPVPEKCHCHHADKPRSSTRLAGDNKPAPGRMKTI